MPETSELVTAAKTLAEHSLQAIHDTWTKVLQWDSHKQGISPTVLFFSPSLILVCFTVISHCFSYTSSFSFLICGAIALHAFLKLTQNPISTSLHYQFIYSCTFSLLVLGYSPALPSAQAKTLLAVLFPIYFHTLTSSVSITLLISCPIFLFLLFSSLHEPFSHTTLLAALIVIPTIFWTKSREEHHILEQISKNRNERQKEMSVTDKKSSSTQDTLPSSSSTELKEKNHDPTLPNAATEEHEKVILGISHDCRNLLNSLKAILTLMKDDISGDETQSNQDDNLQSAIAITEHLTLLLTSLLDFLKKKSDDITTTQEEMKLTTTLEKIWLMIAPNLKRKNLGGSITIRNGTPPSVCLDESKFMGVLLNLIGNAMKFTDTGHIKVNVHWRDSLSENQTYGLQDARANIPIPGEVLKKPSFSPGKPEDMVQQEGLNSTKMTTTTFYDMKEIDSISFTKKCFTVMSDRGNQSERPAFGVLVVTVRDTGCGIDAESLKKLFKKYGQVGSDKEKNKLGLGLGLWYTKYLLGKLNGKIDFRSTKDVGTWVKIEIPCKIIPQKREVRQMIAPEIPLQPQKLRQTYHPCVYIKENDRLAGLLINEYLKKHLSRGAQVFEIQSVLDIVRSEKMRTGIYMIVLGKMSVTRQELQGLRMLNKLHPDEKVPIVLLKEAEDTIQSSEDKDWADLDVEISVKKPIRQTQLDEVLKIVETIVSRSLFKEAIIKQRDEVAHVLIVDDDNTSVLFLQKYLAKNGRACLVAKDGYEATEIYRAKWADIRLIIMDSEMPRMNGLEATKTIRRMGKDEDLKIIGLTGNDTDEFREKAVKIGMNQVFVKPVPTERLLQIVNNALDMRQ